MVGFPKTLRLDFRFDTASPTTPLSTLNGLGSSPFARRYSENRFLFLLLWVLRCFSSPGSPHLIGGDLCSHRPGSPIRTSRYQRLLPAPPGFSQVITSFIGLGARASTVCPFYLDLLSSSGLPPKIRPIPTHPMSPLPISHIEAWDGLPSHSLLPLFHDPRACFLSRRNEESTEYPEICQHPLSKKAGGWPPPVGEKRV